MAREAKIVITSENLAGPAIKSVVKDMLDVEGAAKEVGDSINKAFTAIAIFEAGKKIVEFGADCLKTFGEVERTMTQLKTALGGNEESFSRMGSLIEEMAGKTLASKDEVEKLVAELASLGKSDADIERIADRFLYCTVKLEGVDTRAANLIKSCVEALGGGAAMRSGAHEFTVRETDLIVTGSYNVPLVFPISSILLHSPASNIGHRLIQTTVRMPIERPLQR